jgi:hypothetical protein
MGQIGNEGGKGLLMHTTLAVTTGGLALGILAQQLWARDKKRDRKNYEHKKLSIEDKESQKWLNALEQTMSCLPAAVQVVTVCDREADVFEFLLRAEQLAADYLVRAARDRCLMVGDKCLWQALASSPLAGELEVEAKKDQPAQGKSIS